MKVKCPTPVHIAGIGMLLVTATGLGGCQSLATVATQVDLEMTVEVEGQQAPATGQLFTIPTPRKVPFDNPGYADEALEWRITVATTGFGIDVTNHAGQSVQLRWDQSQWRSSKHSEPTPLLIHHFSTGFLRERQLQIDRHPDEAAVRPVALEIEAGSTLRINIRPERPPVFPRGQLFGIQQVAEGHGFIDDGIGRWLELELPVEMGDQQWTYRIRLTARDIAQWNSYH